MDDLLRLLGKLSDFWGWIAGLVTGAIAAITAWRKCGNRVLRAVLLSDHLHGHLGHNPGKKIAEEFDKRSKNSRLGEVRLQFAESKLGIALYVCSRDGSCEYANDALADLFGLEKAEMTKNGWLQAVDKNERQKAMEFWEYAIQHKMPYDYEYTVVNQSTKERFTAKTQALPVESASGEIVFYVGIVERLSDGGKNP